MQWHTWPADSRRFSDNHATLLIGLIGWAPEENEFTKLPPKILLATLTFYNYWRFPTLLDIVDHYGGVERTLICKYWAEIGRHMHVYR